MFQTMVGRPKHPGIMVGMDQKEFYLGPEIDDNKINLLNLSQPIEKGYVADWDDLETIFYHTLRTELKRSPDNHPIFMGWNSQTSRQDKEKILDLMLEKYAVQQFYMQTHAVLHFYQIGRPQELCWT